MEVLAIVSLVALLCLIPALSVIKALVPFAAAPKPGIMGSWEATDFMKAREETPSWLY